MATLNRIVYPDERAELQVFADTDSERRLLDKLLRAGTSLRGGVLFAVDAQRYYVSLQEAKR